MVIRQLANSRYFRGDSDIHERCTLEFGDGLDRANDGLRHFCPHKNVEGTTEEA